MSMSPVPRASTAVILAAVVAILTALLVFVSMSLAFFGAWLGTAQTSALAAFPPLVRTAALAVTGFTIALSAFGVATGIGLILLRNWARISILIWGGFSVFFGVFGIAIALATTLFSPPEVADLPPGTIQGLRLLLLCIYGAPIIVGGWWLFLFSRENVRAQFAGPAGPLPPAKPGPPVPISVLAWLYITTAAHVVILPFLPFSIPIILFGHLVSGKAGGFVYALLCLIFMVAGVGLLKLKLWSYPLTLGLQLAFLASGIVTFLSPNYPSQIAAVTQRVHDAMHLPDYPYFRPDYPHPVRWSIFLVLFVAAAVIAMLFCYRQRFMQAALSAAALHTDRVNS